MGKGQRLTRGNTDHLLDQINAGDQLGHGMFHLQPGVHFQKIEIARRIHDKFHRARAGISNRFGQGAGLLAHRAARGLIKKGAWGLFDDFLIAALDRTFPFMQIDTIAMAVGQHLNFNMAWLGHKFFNENPIITKTGRRFVFRTEKALSRLHIIPRDPHALATAARTGFDHDRITNLPRYPHGLCLICDQAHIARHGGNTRFRRQFLRGNLVPHCLNRASGRANKGHAFGGQRRSKFRIFRQKTIARMYRLGPRLTNGLHDLVNHDIRLVGGCGADMHRLICHRNMQRIAVCIRINGNRCNAHLAGCLDDTACNLAPIGDQDLFEHGISVC